MRNDRHILMLSENKAMKGIIKGKTVLTQHTARLERRGFGVRKRDKVILHPVEAIYLFLRGDMIIKKGKKILKTPEVFKWAIRTVPEFSELYFAYEDLRERGNRISVSDRFLVGKKTFLPLSERRKFAVPELYKLRKGFDTLILAVVDEESDVTYYRIDNVDFHGRQSEEISKIKGYLVKDRVVTEESEIHTHFFYGNEKNGIVSLSLIESCYLVDKGFMDVYSSGRELSIEEIKKMGRKVEENFDRRYEVYKDLKDRRFCVKTGFKFGSDFRVYDEIKSVEDLPHSNYLVSVVDDMRLPLYEIAGAVRLAQNVRKKMIFAFKEEDENRYLQIEWIKI